MILGGHCSGLSTALWLLPHSPHTQPREQRGSTPSHSGCSCVEGCTCLFPCLTAPADVAANSTCLATIAQRAQRQGCWGRGGSLWSAPPRKSAGRQVLGWPRMCFATWTWRRSTLSMVGGLRSLRRDGSPKPTAANHDGAALEAAWRKKETTYPELAGGVAAPNWWFSPLRWEAGGMLRRRSSSQLCPELVPRKCHWSCKVGPRLRGSDGGVPSSPALQHVFSLCLCWTAALLLAQGSQSLLSKRS